MDGGGHDSPDPLRSQDIQFLLTRIIYMMIINIFLFASPHLFDFTKMYGAKGEGGKELEWKCWERRRIRSLTFDGNK